VRNSFSILVGKSEGKRPLGIRSHRWEDNIRMDVKERGREGVDWMDLAEDKDQWRVPVIT
jgi:hypothetical protein